MFTALEMNVVCKCMYTVQKCMYTVCTVRIYSTVQRNYLNVTLIFKLSGVYSWRINFFSEFRSLDLIVVIVKPQL
jgi:hypothetical protein